MAIAVVVSACPMGMTPIDSDDCAPKGADTTCSTRPGGRPEKRHNDLLTPLASPYAHIGPIGPSSLRVLPTHRAAMPLAASSTAKQR